MPTGSSGCPSARSASVRIHRLLQATARPDVRAADAPCACTRSRAATRSTRSSSPGCFERGGRPDAAAARPRRRWRGWCALVSTGCRRRRATRCCSCRPWSPVRRSCSRPLGVAEDALEPAFAGARDRARGRDDSLHAPAARLGASTKARPRTSDGARTNASPRSSTIRSSARATSRFRRRARTPRSPRDLEDAAALASARGAPIAAAELGEHALRLTPPDAHEDRHRRALAAARAHLAAGEWTRARGHRRRSPRSDAAGRARAEALVLLAELEGPRTRDRAPREALAEARHASGAAGRCIHQRLGWALTLHRGSSGRGAPRACGARARRSSSTTTRCARERSRRSPSFASTPATPTRLRLAERGLRARSRCRRRRAAAARRSMRLAPRPRWSVRADGPAALLERTTSEWRERDESGRASALWYLASSSSTLVAGRWRPSYAEQRARDRRPVRDRRASRVTAVPLALVAAHRGDLDLARERAELGRDAR